MGIYLSYSYSQMRFTNKFNLNFKRNANKILCYNSNIAALPQKINHSITAYWRSITDRYLYVYSVIQSSCTIYRWLELLEEKNMFYKDVETSLKEIFSSSHTAFWERLFFNQHHILPNTLALLTLISPNINTVSSYHLNKNKKKFSTKILLPFN